MLLPQLLKEETRLLILLIYNFLIKNFKILKHLVCIVNSVFLFLIECNVSVILLVFLNECCGE